MIFPRQATAFIITYPVTNAVDKEGNETKKAVAWEKAFIQLAKVHSSFRFSLLSSLISVIIYCLEAFSCAMLITLAENYF